MGKAFVGRCWMHFSELDSTNALLWRVLKNHKLPDGFVVTADFQYEGRGQMQTKWEGDEAKNLLFSVHLDTGFLKTSNAFLLNKAICCALVDVLSGYGIGKPVIKWPNDILVNEKKICGILIQNSVQGDHLNYSVVGVGLNVNQVNFTAFKRHATSVKDITGKDVHLASLKMELEKQVDKAMLNLKTDRRAYDEIYSSNLFGRGEVRKFKTTEGEGHLKIIDVNDIGQLILEKKDGRQKAVNLKEVEFL